MVLLLALTPKGAGQEEEGEEPYGSPYLLDSASVWRCFRRLACIMRHVRFSMRSWLGRLCFVLLKKRQTCVASGSSRSRSSGLAAIPAMPSSKLAKAPGWDSLPCALPTVSWRSNRSSFRLLRMAAAAAAVAAAPLGSLLLLLLLLLLVLLFVVYLVVLLWLLGDVAVPGYFAAAVPPDCSDLSLPVPRSAGLRGNRKSCSVVVGLVVVVDNGLGVDMAAIVVWYGTVRKGREETRRDETSRVESSQVESSFDFLYQKKDGVVEEEKAGRVKRPKRPEFGGGEGISWDLYWGLVPLKERDP